jgi:hypothetical protein
MAALTGEDLLLDQAAVCLGLSPVSRPVPLPQLLTQLRLEQAPPADPGSHTTNQNLRPDSPA